VTDTVRSAHLIRHISARHVHPAQCQSRVVMPCDEREKVARGVLGLLPGSEKGSFLD
jgi:hypothetical protein